MDLYSDMAILQILSFVEVEAKLSIVIPKQDVFPTLCQILTLLLTNTS